MSTETRQHLRELRADRRARRNLAADKAAGAAVVEAWNAAHPSGTPVTLTKDDGSTIETATRSVAWALGNGEPVVLVEGITGCYALDRIRPRVAA